MLVEQNKQWRILQSNQHSTVWDGEEMLFDFNFLAFGVDPQRCFDLAHTDGREHAPGNRIRVSRPQHYSSEATQHRAGENEGTDAPLS